MKTIIHFIRHGSVANPDKILYGRLPEFSLSPKGVTEVKETAFRLKDKKIDAIYTSPMLRALQTAEEIHAFHESVSVIKSDKLNEVLTPYQGMKAIDLRHLNEDFYTGTQKTYEQPGDVVERVEGFIREVREQNKRRELVAVTHGDIIVFLILKIKGLKMVPENKARLTLAGLQDNYPATASITTLSYFTETEDEAPLVEYYSSGG